MILLYSVFKRLPRWQPRPYILAIASIVVLIFTTTADAEYIARINLRQGTNTDSIYLKLLEKAAPLTVQNFLNYAHDGDYAKSFIHRSMPGFIVQGGGFTFDPALNGGAFMYDAANDLYPGGLQKVPADTAIINEFGHSNLRGTFAMAKVAERYVDGSGAQCFIPGSNCTLVPGTGPDTATSQWFVNMADNSADLDTLNGGFTVFAEVLGNGMDVFDTIVNQPVYDQSNIHPAFKTLPLLNLSGPVSSNNLILVESIGEVLSISPDIDYGTVTSGTNVQPEIVIKNTGLEPLVIGGIGIQNALLPPFYIVSDKCSNRTLSAGQRCALIALFSPESAGTFADDFDVEFPGLGINYTIKLSGEGGPAASEVDIMISFSSVNFGVLDIFYDQNAPPYRKQLFINTYGDLQLDLTKIELSPTSDPEFTLTGDCLDKSSLLSGDSCVLNIMYLPLLEGTHSALLTIESNDPDESPFEIPIFAVALPEMDGVDADVENAAPNSGDGNNDGLLDSQQSNVVSLPDLNGTYMTYVSFVNKPFSNVRIVDKSTFVEDQAGVILSAGVHELTLNNMAADEIVEVGLLLPAGIEPSDYYIYSSSSDVSLPHWHKFDYDGETGVLFLGVAIVPSPNGINRYLLMLRLKNGGRGDISSVQNNTLTLRTGVNYHNRDSGGSLSLIFLLIMLLTLLFLSASRQCLVGTFYRPQ